MKIRLCLVVAAFLTCCYPGSEVCGQVTGNERKAISASATLFQKENEFNWRGRVAAGEVFEIFGVKGDIQVEASAGNEIEVVAIKQGNQDEFSQVDVRVEKPNGRVRICVAFPNLEGTGGSQCLESFEWSSQMWNDNRELRIGYEGGRKQSIRFIGVQVRFKVRIPAGVHFIARTLRGNITARFGTADISSPIDLSTFDGSVSFEAPKAFNAQVAMATSGKITTDFSTASLRQISSDRVEGSVGQGGPRISLRSWSGDVKLNRAK